MMATHLTVITNDGFKRLNKLAKPALKKTCNDLPGALEILQLMDLAKPELLPAAFQALGYDLGGTSATGYHCEVLNTDLTTSCANRYCRYWVDYNPSDNCVLAHMQKHELTDLTNSQISYLTRLHPTAVSRLLNKAMVKLRHSSVAEAILTGQLDQDFVFATEPDLCCVCESKGTPTHTWEGLMWCSAACWSKLGPCEVELERKFNVEVSKLLRWLAREFGSWDTSISLLADAVGVKAASLAPVWEKYRQLYQPPHPKPPADHYNPLDEVKLSPLDGLQKKFEDVLATLDDAVEDTGISAQAEFTKLGFVCW